MSIINGTTANPDVISEHFREAKKVGGGTKLYLHNISFPEAQVGPSEKSNAMRIYSTNPEPLTRITQDTINDKSVINVRIYMYISNDSSWMTMRGATSQNIGFHGLFSNSVTQASLSYDNLRSVVDVVEEM